MDPLFDIRKLVPYLFAIGALIWVIVGLWEINKAFPGSLKTALSWLIFGWILIATAITIHLSKGGK